MARQGIENRHSQCGEPRLGDKSGLVCKNLVVRGPRLQPRDNNYKGYKVKGHEILEVYKRLVKAHGGWFLDSQRR